MIIEVKGTKPAKPDTEDSHERYVLKNQDKRSNAPLFFTMFLTGLALYLKSAFPRLANSVAESEDERPPEPSDSAGPTEAAAQCCGSSHRHRSRGRPQEKPPGSGEPLLYYREFALRA